MKTEYYKKLLAEFDFGLMRAYGIVESTGELASPGVYWSPTQKYEKLSSDQFILGSLRYMFWGSQSRSVNIDIDRVVGALKEIESISEDPLKQKQLSDTLMELQLLVIKHGEISLSFE